MYRVLGILLLCVFIISGCSLLNNDDKSASNTIQTVAETLRIDEPPILPTVWEIQSIEKYDDGFTSPSVTIKYVNGASIYLSKSDWDLSHELNSQALLMLGDKQIEQYYNSKEEAYVFKLKDLMYVVRIPLKLKSEIEKVIIDLIAESKSTALNQNHSNNEKNALHKAFFSLSFKQCDEASLLA